MVPEGKDLISTTCFSSLSVSGSEKKMEWRRNKNSNPSISLAVIQFFFFIPPISLSHSLFDPNHPVKGYVEWQTKKMLDGKQQNIFFLFFCPGIFILFNTKTVSFFTAKWYKTNKYVRVEGLFNRDLVIEW